MSDPTNNKKEFLRHLDREHYFFAANGTVARSLPELDQLLENMAADTFQNHVNMSKNDFANWVISSVGDTILGEQLVNVHEKSQMQLLILRRIVQLRS